jgi:hypothetical protein
MHRSITTFRKPSVTAIRRCRISSNARTDRISRGSCESLRKPLWKRAERSQREIHNMGHGASRLGICSVGLSYTSVNLRDLTHCRPTDQRNSQSSTARPGFRSVPEVSTMERNLFHPRLDSWLGFPQKPDRMKLHYGMALETRPDVAIVALSMRGGKAHRCSVIHHSMEYVVAHQASAHGAALRPTLYRFEDCYWDDAWDSSERRCQARLAPYYARSLARPAIEPLLLGCKYIVMQTRRRLPGIGQHSNGKPSCEWQS